MAAKQASGMTNMQHYVGVDNTPSAHRNATTSVQNTDGRSLATHRYRSFSTTPTTSSPAAAIKFVFCLFLFVDWPNFRNKLSASCGRSEQGSFWRGIAMWRHLNLSRPRTKSSYFHHSFYGFDLRLQRNSLLLYSTSSNLTTSSCLSI
jgi:hypothetical protein